MKKYVIFSFDIMTANEKKNVKTRETVSCQSKQDINKLLVIGFIEYVKEATWLSLKVIVPKKNGKLKIYIDFKVIICFDAKRQCM